MFLSAPSAKMVFTQDKETAIKYLPSARATTLTMDNAQLASQHTYFLKVHASHQLLELIPPATPTQEYTAQNASRDTTSKTSFAH